MDSADALLAADLLGVAVFAVSGASAGVAKQLDIFGVVFVGFMTAMGGGIFRDLVINTVPPLAFSDWRYAAVAMAASLATFRFHPQIGRLSRTVLTLDAAGLGLFTVTGTLKALHDPAGVPAVGACLIGMFTGMGGGLARDLLVGEIPAVLRHEIYALAALAGAGSVVILTKLGHDQFVPLFAAALLVFVIRMTALKRKWSAPVARPREPGPTGWPARRPPQPPPGREPDTRPPGEE